jgi:hypothetical protein
MPGHDKTYCQIFVNIVLTAHFAKEDPAVAMKVLRGHKKIMRLYKGRTTPKIHQLVEEPIDSSNDLDNEAPCAVSATMFNAIVTATINIVRTEVSSESDDDSSINSDYSDINIPSMLLRHISECASSNSDEIDTYEYVTPAIISIIAANWNK